ncbi:ketoreductase, putative [Babesia ovata]|uniref:Ketoreductase, putative n=1 Tax=Babesia ovata TaxID=189622 RepID=A0A2H6KJU4_9APIC|nr:ketoreductase, putative [Babesia ovata]GBE63249.1 ketoreductase, putative [Babesia ovata]
MESRNFSNSSRCDAKVLLKKPPERAKNNLRAYSSRSSKNFSMGSLVDGEGDGWLVGGMEAEADGLWAELCVAYRHGALIPERLEIDDQPACLLPAALCSRRRRLGVGLDGGRELGAWA